jgi:hypothetical protein
MYARGAEIDKRAHFVALFRAGGMEISYTADLSGTWPKSKLREQPKTKPPLETLAGDSAGFYAICRMILST